MITKPVGPVFVILRAPVEFLEVLVETLQAEFPFALVKWHVRDLVNGLVQGF